MSRPVVLMILDGWGISPDREGNAVAQARTPNFDRLMLDAPHATLTTFGTKVGLPEGQMGNSEVGHLNIGAGRVVFQELPRINNAIETGELADALVASSLVETLRNAGGRCHLLGLISDGGVHAHMDHAIALSRILVRAGIEVLIHAFTDGRDTAPSSAARFLEEFEGELPEGARVATVSGRFYAMDRDNRWERVQRAYDAIAAGRGLAAATAQQAIASARLEGKTDEFIEPAIIGGYDGVRPGDAILSFNFRSDRMREILAALVKPDFEGFARPDLPPLSAAVGMVSYGGGLDGYISTLFAPQTLEDGLSETIAKHGRHQVHLAETEKYPHVTYFLNGGREQPFEGEERVMVPSPKVATYDLQPEMSAPELADRVVQKIEAGLYDFMVVNFANPDMVGHTGILSAAITAVETVDMALGRIRAAVEDAGGSLMVIADHGNCEEMIDRVTGAPHTAHTLNPVPVLVMTEGVTSIKDGILADVAPTILELMGIDQPTAMTGRSLIR